MISHYFKEIIDLYLLNPIAQTSGIFGMLCIWIAFLYKDDLKTIRMLFLATFFWGILYFLLESYAGLVAVSISALRLYLSMRYKKNTKVFMFLIIIILTTGVLTYDSYYSLLPVLGSLIGAYSFFFFSGIILRVWCLSISIVWLIYSIHLGSIGGIMNEIVVESLILVAIYKHIGVNGYRMLFISKINSIIHPYRHVDYGHYTIVKDKEKIVPKSNLVEKIRTFFTKEI